MRLALVESIGQCPARALLTIPAGVTDRANGPWRSDVLRRIIAALPPQVELVAAGHPEPLKRLRSWAEALCRPRVQFVDIETSVDFTPWCQDAFLAARDEAGAPAMILSARPARQADAFVANAVAEATGTPCLTAPFTFEGGNVVTGEDFVFVGRDTVGGAEDEDPLSALGLLGERRRLCPLGASAEMPPCEVRLWRRHGRVMVELLHGFAGRRQPIFHIDAFLSVAGRGPDGRERILVGDTALARSLIGEHPLLCADAGLRQQLDEIAADIAGRPELEVIRNPLPVIGIDDDGLFAWSRHSVLQRFGGIDGIDEVLLSLDRSGLDRIPVRRWCVATQNGAIPLRNEEGAGTVLLPSYAQGRFRFLEPSERWNAELWRRLGFTVAEVPRFAGFAVENGSARCLLKLLASGSAAVC